MNLKKNFNLIENFIFVIFITIFLIFFPLSLFTNLISDQIFEIKLRSLLLLLFTFLSLIFYIYDKNRESIPLFYIYFLFFHTSWNFWSNWKKKYKGKL